MNEQIITLVMWPMESVWQSFFLHRFGLPSFPSSFSPARLFARLLVMLPLACKMNSTPNFDGGVYVSFLFNFYFLLAYLFFDGLTRLCLSPKKKTRRIFLIAILRNSKIEVQHIRNFDKHFFFLSQ